MVIIAWGLVWGAIFSCSHHFHTPSQWQLPSLSAAVIWNARQLLCGFSMEILSLENSINLSFTVFFLKLLLWAIVSSCIGYADCIPYVSCACNVSICIWEISPQSYWLGIKTCTGADLNKERFVHSVLTFDYTLWTVSPFKCTLFVLVDVCL